ncbi:MAG: peptide-methionine (R)-S-oxide reductase MsrB [Bacillota bacterium]
MNSKLGIIVFLGIIILVLIWGINIRNSNAKSQLQETESSLKGVENMDDETDFLINKNPDFWKEILTDSEFEVLVNQGTDRPMNNKYNDHKETGIYVCAACDNPLFSSQDKYDSGSGWPSFSDVIGQGVVGTRTDKKLAQERTEVICARCGGHLGHVFQDGPEPTGLRYCINSSSIKFLQHAYLALGCFWGPDASFGAVEGVYFTASGYAGGKKENPNYHNLGSHSETVRITYDPEIISFKEILTKFWDEHNPFSEAYSEQYKSIIFYNDNQQEDVAREFLEEKKEQNSKTIYTELKQMNNFTEAEDYHQNYQLGKNRKLKQYREKLINAGEKLTYSRIMTKLNAYSAGQMNSETMEEELNNNYLNVQDKELIANIIKDL